MAGPVQWSIDQLWGQLQSLKDKIARVGADLNADKLALQAAYSAARKRPDPQGAQDRALLDPLIHRNTELRLNYLAPVRDKFNQAVQLASNALKSAGYSTPTLSGLGVVFAIAPATAVTLVLVALAAIATVALLTQAQRNRTAATLAILSDRNTTPAQKAALLKAHQDEMQKEKDTRPPPPGLDLGFLVPALALVAAIVLVPRFVPARRASA